MSRVVSEIEEGLAGVPVIDIHTHLVGGHLGAKGLHDILLYHMAISDLYAAGCPTGSRLTEYPGRPTAAEAHARIREALPYLHAVRNTGISWGIRRILADLYGWHDPVTTDNWRGLDERIRERADDEAWHWEVLRKCNIRRVGSEWARRGEGLSDNVLQYALEWGFFTRCQWGEFDTALYELERCWGKTPGSPMPIVGGHRPETERAIRSLDDATAAMAWYVEQIPADRILATATHLSTDLDLQVVTEDEFAQTLKRRDTAGPKERDIYASYINEAYLDALEQRYGDRIVFQFSYGAEPLPHETASRLSQWSIAQLGDMISRHPGLRFQCFLASRHANQSLCTLCRELPNLSLAGYWWHNYFPTIIQSVMKERLEMLPVNRQIAFFSDAYCAEWVYGKAFLMRKCLARVLADHVAEGRYSRDEAMSIARDILLETPKTLLGFAESKDL